LNECLSANDKPEPKEREEKKFEIKMKDLEEIEVSNLSNSLENLHFCAKTFSTMTFREWQSAE
jgi:hypothetical protein